MKVFIGVSLIGVLGAAVEAPLSGPMTDPPSTETIESSLLPGQAAFDLELKTETEQFERAKLRYEEATERARLNYVHTLEVTLEDADDARAAEYHKELIRVRSLKFHAPKFEFTTYRWENNAPPVKMIHKDDGFCYVADFGGAFNGGAEVARVYIGEDGYWYLHGSTGHGFLVVGAIAVKLSR